MERPMAIGPASWGQRGSFFRRLRPRRDDRARGALPAPATYAAPPTFLGCTRSDPGSKVCVAGIPFDLGTTNRPGARFGPSAIRQASRMLTDGEHPLHWTDPCSAGLADIGNFTLALGDIRESLAKIEAQAAPIAHLVALGGDHGVTLPLLRALAKRQDPPALIHFDAHIDTWPENFGQSYAHGSIFYHAIVEKLIDPQRMVQVGLRSPLPRDVHDWTRAQGVVSIAAQGVHERGPASISAQVREVIGAAPVYLSFDIDVLDPAFAPGTGTPEIAGRTSV